MIPFNKPYISGKEAHYMYQAVFNGQVSGNGMFTKKCHAFFEERCEITKTLLTTSCTDALEMCALLLDIKPGDEVIIPSYTFVSTALAFARQGATIVFADSRSDHPGIFEEKIDKLINKNTKAIVPVHYAGISCDMDKIMDVAKKYNIWVIEDAAQAIDGKYKGRPLGSIGHLACFSFHETKNIQCGEGGLLAINDVRFIKRAEIIWEKGTNRAEFFRGEVNKYNWVDIGSSFLPSDILAGFLYAQLENIDDIQKRRRHLWDKYYSELKVLQEQNFIQLPYIPEYSTNNAHMFYILCGTENERKKLISYLKERDIHAVFHYLALEKSPYYSPKYNGEDLPNSQKYSDILLRLPLFYELKDSEQNIIIDTVINFYTQK